MELWRQYHRFGRWKVAVLAPTLATAPCRRQWAMLGVGPAVAVAAAVVLVPSGQRFGRGLDVTPPPPALSEWSRGELPEHRGNGAAGVSGSGGRRGHVGRVRPDGCRASTGRLRRMPSGSRVADRGPAREQVALVYARECCPFADVRGRPGPALRHRWMPELVGASASRTG